MNSTIEERIQGQIDGWQGILTELKARENVIEALSGKIKRLNEFCAREEQVVQEFSSSMEIGPELDVESIINFKSMMMEHLVKQIAAELIERQLFEVEWEEDKNKWPSRKKTKNIKLRMRLRTLRPLEKEIG